MIITTPVTECDLQELLNIQSSFELSLSNLRPLIESEESYRFKFSQENESVPISRYFLSTRIRAQSVSLQQQFALYGPVLLTFEETRADITSSRKPPFKGQLGAYTGLQANRVENQPSVLNLIREFPFISGASDREHPWYEFRLDLQLRQKIQNHTITLNVSEYTQHPFGESQKWRWIEG